MADDVSIYNGITPQSESLALGDSASCMPSPSASEGLGISESPAVLVIRVSDSMGAYISQDRNERRQGLSVPVTDSLAVYLSDRAGTAGGRLPEFARSIPETMPVSDSLALRLHDSFGAMDSPRGASVGIISSDSISLHDSYTGKEFSSSEGMALSDQGCAGILLSEGMAFGDSVSYRESDLHDSATAQEYQETEASIPSQDSFAADDSVSRKAMSYPCDLPISDTMSQRAYLYREEAESLDSGRFYIAEIAGAVEACFPDYFYLQKPYSLLIDAMVSQASLCYALSDYIPLVYDADRLPADRKHYNSLLRLIGISHDFSDYPEKMLRVLIRNYLSIRKYRGTRRSILAMLRTMDEAFNADPSDACEMKITPLSLKSVSGVEVSEQAGILIEYPNVSARYYDHVMYMLSKVVPTGIRYELANRQITVSDSAGIIDRGYAEDTGITTWQVSDTARMTESVPVRSLEVSDSMAVSDTRAERGKERMEISDTAFVLIQSADTLGAADESAYGTVLSAERMPSSDSLAIRFADTAQISEGLAFGLSDAAEASGNISIEREGE